MKKLWTALNRELAAGRPAVLCSIVASRGSTPRGAGARMLVCAGGETTGTIGGGAVEHRAALTAAALLEKGASRFAQYRLTPSDTADIGMICGGDVRVYFQYIDPADRRAGETLDRVLALLDSPGAAWLVTEMDGSGWRMGTFDWAGGLRGLDVPMERLEPLLGSRGMLEEGETVLYAEPLTRAGTVYLFGGGHVAQALVPALAAGRFRRWQGVLLLAVYGVYVALTCTVMGG